MILHSADGGSTWERQRVDVEALGPLLDVIFLDDSNGFAIGAEGKMFFTSDAGKTWTDRNITELTTQDLRPKVDANEEESGLASDDMGVDETPPHLNAVVQNKIGLLIVGESGAAFRSTDSGLSWARIEIPYHGPLFGAVVLSDDSIIAYGLNGNAFQTSDLGNTWQKLETGTEATLMGAVAVPGGRAVIVGSRGVFLTKAADSNVLKSFTFSDGGILGGVLQRGETDFVVVGENGILAYSPK